MKQIMFNAASPIPGTSKTLQGLYETCSYNQLTYNETTNHVVDLSGVPGPCSGAAYNNTATNYAGYAWNFTTTCSAFELYGIAQWAEQYISSVRDPCCPPLPAPPSLAPHCSAVPPAELGIGLDQPDLVPEAPAHPACHHHMLVGRHGLCGLR